MSQQTTLHRYEGRGGTVTYDVKRCVHAGACSRGLPAVFDSKAKPWVNPDGADTAAVATVVERCPSGALHIERADGIAEVVPDRNTATLTAGGPAYLRGDLAVMAQDSGVALADTRMALCRCGASTNKPFCDRSHAKVGFADQGTLRAPEKPAAVAAAGRLQIRVRPNGPLMLTGPLTIIGTNGRSAFSETTFLCRCGASHNKPYCDGAHMRIGFVG